jgi:hypothetical protein
MMDLSWSKVTAKTPALGRIGDIARRRFGPDTSAGANQTVPLPTPRRVARPAGNAPHGTEHAHELTERLRVGENVRIRIV